MSIRVATYARQSEDLKDGIDRQEIRTQALASTKGWTLVNQYADDGTSAYKQRGPKSAWGRMLVDAKAGRFTHLIAVDMDRLLRSPKDLLTLMDLGIRVVTVDGEIDLSTADGEYRGMTMAISARFEVRRKSERQIRANEARVAKGRPVPGRRRYGYEVDGITPRESEAVTVRWIFEQIAAGASVRSIAMSLNDRGILPTTGQVKAWSPRRIRETANNASYGGLVVHQGTLAPSDLLVPLVAPEEAERVRAILADPTRKTTPGNAVKHLLSGIAVCGVCGGTMHFMRDYRCKADSSHPTIKKNFLEPFVINEVAAAFMFGHPSDFTSSQDVDVHMLMTARQKLQVRAERLLEAFLDGDVDKATHRAKKAEIAAQQEALDEQIQDARTSSATTAMILDLGREVRGPGRVSITDAVEAKKAILERFDSLGLDRQRELIKGYLDITVSKGRTMDRVSVTHKVVASLNDETAA